MIDPTAIVRLDDASVTTESGDVSGVSRLAVYEYDLRPNRECYLFRTNDGHVWVDSENVQSIRPLESDTSMQPTG